LAVVTDTTALTITSQTWWDERKDWTPGVQCNGDSSADQPLQGAIGAVWCDDPQLQKAIGKPDSPPENIQGDVQEFEGGFMLRDDDPQTIHYLFRDDRSYRREAKP
jgi:hypothetical protein